LATSEVDLTNHTLAAKLDGSFTDLAHKLVTGDTPKAHVASEDLVIGRTDSGQANSNQGPVFIRLRCRIRGVQP